MLEQTAPSSVGNVSHLCQYNTIQYNIYL